MKTDILGIFRSRITGAVVSTVIAVGGVAWVLIRGGIALYPVHFEYEYTVNPSLGVAARRVHPNYYAYAAVFCDPARLPSDDVFTLTARNLSDMKFLSDRPSLFGSDKGIATVYNRSIRLADLRFGPDQGGALLVMGKTGNFRPSASVLRSGVEGLTAGYAPKRAYLLSEEEIGLVALIGALVGAVAKPAMTSLLTSMRQASDIDSAGRRMGRE